MSGIGPTGVILCVHSSALQKFPLLNTITITEEERGGPTYRRVNLLMTLCVVFLDMLKLRRLSESGYIPVQMPQPLMQRRVPRADIADIALKMLDVDGVEPNDGGIKANVCFGDGFAEVIGCRVLCQVSFRTVKGGEEGLDGLFVGFLGSVGKHQSCFLGVVCSQGGLTVRSQICIRRC